MKIIAALMIFALFACAPKEQPRETTLMKSYRLIDEGRSDEAIDLLEQASEEEPDNVELKVTLASAYARKADVRVQTLAPVVFAVQKYDALRNAKPTSSTKKNPDVPSNDGISSVLSAFAKISSIWSIYESVPALTKEQLPYLKHAVNILDANSKALTPKDHAYRAVLKAVILKAVIETEIMSSPDLLETRFDVCKPNFVALQGALNQIATVLNDIIDDVIIANPKQKESMEHVREEIVLGLQKASVAVSSLSGGDGSLLSIVRERAVAEGFGRVFQCD